MPLRVQTIDRTFNVLPVQRVHVAGRTPNRSIEPAPRPTGLAARGPLSRTVRDRSIDAWMFDLYQVARADKLPTSFV